MSFSEPSSGVITQTGSDMNLSSLSGNSGVTITTDEGMTYYDFGVNRLIIKGGLKINPESEVAIFQHDQNVNGSGTVLSISGSIIAGWKYGMSISYNSEGYAVVTFTSDTTYELGQSLYFQSVSGESANPKRKFNNLPHLIKGISADTREITLDYKDEGDTLTTSGARAQSYPGFEFGGIYSGYGKTRTARGVGIFITGQSNNNWNPSGYGMSGSARTKFVANGGTIVISRPWSFVSHVDWADLKLVNPKVNWSPEARGMSTGYVTNVELVNMSIGNFSSLYTKEFNLVNASFFRTYGDTYELPLFNVDTSENVNGYDFGDASGTGHGHTLVKSYNPSAGSSFRSMWRNTTGSGGQPNVTETYKNVTINIKDANNIPLEDVKVHVKDNPSQYAKHTALRDKSGGSHSHSVSISAATPAVVTFTAHGFSTGDCVAIYNFPNASGASGADVVNGRKKITVIDANSFSLQDFDGSDVVGTINHAVGSGTLATALEYNNLNANEYLKTSDSSGVISEFSILTGTQVKEYGTNERAAMQEFGGPYDIDTFASAWKDSTLNRGASYSDWDTERFGGFYKVDRRGEGNTDNDTFKFNFCAYDKMLGTSARSLLGTQTLSFDWLLFDDLNIVDSKASVEAYTEVSTPQEFYDAAKLHLVNNYAGETSTIVTRSGNEINAGSYDVVVDASAASVFAISGNTLTIKATTFVGNISTSGSTTLSNGAEVIGTFGSTTVLSWEVKNVEATTRLQLYNLTKDSLVVTQKLSGTPGTYVDATGTYNQTEIAVGDIIRLRCTCVVGATAMLPVEITGVATSTGVTFSVNQVPDQVYNSNGINGSTVSTLTADYSNPMGVDVSDADGIASVKEIYAFFVYSTTTEDGVHLWFGGMRGIDNANYEVLTANSDIKIQNIGSNAVVVSDGRIYRDNGTSVLYAEDGDQPISMDSGSPVASIQPQVEAALNNNAKIAGIDKKSKLIPAIK